MLAGADAEQNAKQRRAADQKQRTEEGFAEEGFAQSFFLGRKGLIQAKLYT